MNDVATSRPDHTGGRTGRNNNDTGLAGGGDGLTFPMGGLLVGRTIGLRPMMSFQRSSDITADTHRQPLLAGILSWPSG